jgi:hypothetical protein
VEIEKDFDVFVELWAEFSRFPSSRFLVLARDVAKFRRVLNHYKGQKHKNLASSLRAV